MNRCLWRTRGMPVAFTTMLLGCAMMGQGGQTGEQITAPDASVSPKMDFTRIAKVGVFPLFPSGGVEEAQFAENLIGALTTAVEARQSQWKIVGYRELVELVTRARLGQGYKNLQADFNTYGGPGGQFVMSSGTQQFLTELQKASGVDAFLIGTYTLSTEQRVVKGLVGTYLKQVEVSTVHLTLYYAKDGERWWTAGVGRAGDRAAVIDEMAKSLAAYLGKGTLRQL